MMELKKRRRKMTRRSTYELVDVDLHVPMMYYILQPLPINHIMTNAIICNLSKAGFPKFKLSWLILD